MKIFSLFILSIMLVLWGVPAISHASNMNHIILLQQEPEPEPEEEELQEEEQEPEEELEEELEEEEEQVEEEQEPEEELEQELEEIMEDAPPSSEERMKYYKDKYEQVFDQLFEDVWNAIKKSLEECNCQSIKETYNQSDEGFYKGQISSDFCVFAMGSDTTIDNLKKYSIKVPVIRGGLWVTGRFQYKFIIKERDDGSVYLRIKGEVSGFEDYVTTHIHFWESNGYLETMMLRRIRKNLGMKEK